MKNSVLSAVLVAAVLVGCGSAGNNGGQDAGTQISMPDAGTQLPVDAGNNNNNNTPDAGELDAGQMDAGQPDAGSEPTCLVDTADFGALNTLEGQIEADENGIIFETVLTDDVDMVSLQFFNGYGAFTNGVVPGVYTLSGADLNYETCGACVLMYANADSEDGQVYMATGGTLTLTSVEGRFTGSLSDFTFEHVTVNENTFHSTPVGDGCVSKIGSASFDVEIP